MAVTTNGAPQSPIITTDSRVGGRVFVGTTTPTAPLTGDVWIDNSSGIAVLTTKGDLLSSNGTLQTRVAVGTDTQVLVADSANSSGLSWATRGGRTLITTVSPSAASSITSGALPGIYKQIQIVWFGTQSAADQGFTMRLNGVSTGVYSWTATNGATVSAGTTDTSFGATSFNHGPIPAYAATYAHAGIITIQNYASSSQNKVVSWQAAGRTGTTNVISQGVGTFNQTAAVTSVDFVRTGTQTFTGTFLIYGVN